MSERLAVDVVVPDFQTQYHYDETIDTATLECEIDRVRGQVGCALTEETRCEADRLFDLVTAAAEEAE
jgi:hypothetical protein